MTKRPNPREIARQHNEAIGERLRLCRVACGLSQAALGKKLGLTFQQIQKYERGTNRISAGALAIAAAEIGVPLSYFYEECGVLPAQASGQSRLALELHRIFAAMPEAARRSLINVARAMQPAAAAA